MTGRLETIIAAATIAALTSLGCGRSADPARDTTAAGGTSNGNGSAALPPASQANCDNGDQGACVRLAQQTCKNDVWQLEFDELPTIYVAHNGLIRVDYYGLALIGTSSHEWLACMEQCPGTNSTKVCVPIGFDLSFAMSEQKSCQQRIRDILPWNAREAKSLLIDCPNARAEITYVPELRAVQKALIAAKTVAITDVLAQLDGLMVKMNIADDQEFMLERISRAHCSVFDLPKGYRVISSAQAFTDLKMMHPDLEKKFRDASDALVRKRLSEARANAQKKIDAQVRAICEKTGRDVSTPEKLRACARETEGVDAIETKVLTQETARAVQALTPRLEALLRREYVAPVCKKFAP